MSDNMDLLYDDWRPTDTPGHMFSKVVGSTFVENGQQLIAELKENDELRLIPEPDNQYDSNAIAVYRWNNRIGYLPKETAKSVKDIMADNEVRCKVNMVTGGGARNYGCNLSISW